MNERKRSGTIRNPGNGLISIAEAFRRAVFLPLTAITAIMALTALVTGCGSSSGGSGGAAEGGQGRPAYAPVQNERFAVGTVELSAILLDNQKYARWTFGLKLRQPVQLRSIRIEDVTEGSPVLLVNDQAPQVEANAWTGYTGAIEPSASALPWLFDNAPAKRTFRITVTDLNGQDSVLEQPVTYPVKTKKDLIKWYGFSA
ncbi:MAG: hypothetical protein JOZ08_02030 [Verrucomicrobia bacterium]|nr:hypothetical protein [Verrucomicrobiota bacterium]MBV8275844.1 hypothetical protein [Verrucomicrobiota bacterium]